MEINEVRVKIWTVKHLMLISLTQHYMEHIDGQRRLCTSQVVPEQFMRCKTCRSLHIKGGAVVKTTMMQMTLWCVLASEASELCQQWQPAACFTSALQRHNLYACRPRALLKLLSIELPTTTDSQRQEEKLYD